MNDQKLALDLSDLTVESIAVVPADSLDSAAYGHGMREFAHSCESDCNGSCFMPDQSDDV